MTLSIETIRRAAADWSIEVTPTGAAKIESFRECLAPGTTVNVTFLPGTDPSDTIAVAERLHNDGMRPVPHLAARSLRNADQLDELLTAFTTRCGVEEVLCIGGGVDNPVGDFSATIEVLESGLIQKHGIRHIGVAGHPEGSPDISDDEVATALSAKNDLAARDGLELYIETQFCFEADIVLDWERRVREAGNRLPIRIGIPGPATIKTLFRFAQISGIGPSMRFVAKQAKNVAKLMTVQSPHLLIAGLAEGMAADEDCLIRHFHYYPFGGFARTAAYAGAIAEGRIDLLPKGGFDVTEG
ncbi:MAG: methylenetetrahydrofolate reductase [Pseudomonadota bacterium]|nr:methylenetetrahydrofolate reductase [Pseudomonadota bacterium]MEC7305375.1 methylenetetrahydrofolate reductase [Pseudomonadota bacterium]MEC7486284.1 methylenetetrahydrofolate reductase [Pseudomonadota bacterium]MEC7494648.1 methylenetetrahydrofolate reductase [Pseudomonadota bacterium]MEC7852093.1 methylenetetrahydrofolate reductase [Pseudomonadota bacterium]